MSSPVVAGSDLAGRRAARQSYERPWAMSQAPSSSCIRNRPALHTTTALPSAGVQGVKARGKTPHCRPLPSMSTHLHHAGGSHSLLSPPPLIILLSHCTCLSSPSSCPIAPACPHHPPVSPLHQPDLTILLTPHCTTLDTYLIHSAACQGASCETCRGDDSQGGASWPPVVSTSCGGGSQEPCSALCAHFHRWREFASLLSYCGHFPDLALGCRVNLGGSGPHYSAGRWEPAQERTAQGGDQAEVGEFM